MPYTSEVDGKPRVYGTPTDNPQYSLQNRLKDAQRVAGVFNRYLPPAQYDIAFLDVIFDPF